MATRTKTEKQPSLSAAAALAATARQHVAKAAHDARIGIRSALTSLAYKEAVRIGCLGDTGCGKSRLMRAIATEYQRLVPGLVFVVCQSARKAETWGGQVRKWPTDLKLQPLAKEPRLVVFTGDFVGNEKPLVAVADLAWRYAEAGFPVLAIFDELANATHPQAPGVWLGAAGTSVARIFKEGRDHGVSVLWGTQFPQEVPLAALNESEDVFAFRMAGSALNNLRKKGFTSPEAEAVLNVLPDTKTPPAQRGAHLHLVRGHQWNGRIYRVKSQ